MALPVEADTHAGRMDGIYRYQRHVYDLTRKYYLLGRDRTIAGLAVPAGGSMLELGCGTGRNLLLAATHYPDTAIYGIDISRAMLETAQAAVTRAGRDGKIRIAEADASDFDLQRLFGVPAVDRVMISYSLSMIPPWRRTIAAGLDALRPGGQLHIVDFGQQEDLPPSFRSLLHGWLARFHVEPRADLLEELRRQADMRGAALSIARLHRGYAWHAVVALQS